MSRSNRRPIDETSSREGRNSNARTGTNRSITWPAIIYRPTSSASNFWSTTAANTDVRDRANGRLLLGEFCPDAPFQRHGEAHSKEAAAKIVTGAFHNGIYRLTRGSARYSYRKVDRFFASSRGSPCWTLPGMMPWCPCASRARWQIASTMLPNAGATARPGLSLKCRASWNHGPALRASAPKAQWSRVVQTKDVTPPIVAERQLRKGFYGSQNTPKASILIKHPRVQLKMNIRCLAD